LQLIQELRRSFANEIPAILLTGDTSLAKLGEIKGLGSCEILNKPVEVNKFTDVIYQMLEKRSSN
jgi:DNA-binding NtrC family response regulator